MRPLYAVLLAAWAIFLSSGTITAQESTPSSVPDPVPLLDSSAYDLANYLLLGSDTSNPQNNGRTDAIMVVSVNRTAGTVALLSIPRDLYLYIPDWGMGRINTAYAHGEAVEAGRGPQLLIDTIRYNLGLTIDHYARVDFIGFKRIVDGVGGVELPVDCAIQDWRLIEPDMDPTIEENWAIFTLPIGMQHVDGDLALWYVRSRRTSSDLDRGRRQQALMRAMWQHVRALGLLEQLRDIWPQVLDVVQTDMSLQDVLGLVPLALQLEPSSVASYAFALDREVDNWTDPEGASVLVPRPDAVAALMNDFIQPPTEHQLQSRAMTVRIANASGSDDLPLVVASKLSWEGFVTQIDSQPRPSQQVTTITDYTGSSKGSRMAELQELLRVADGSVTQSPDSAREVDYEVVIGWSFYACTRSVQPVRADD